MYLSLQVGITTSCNSLLHFLSILEGLFNTEQKTPPWDFYSLGHYTFTNGISRLLFKRLNCFPHSYIRMRSLMCCWPQNRGDSKEMCLLLLWSLRDCHLNRTHPVGGLGSWGWVGETAEVSLVTQFFSLGHCNCERSETSLVPWPQQWRERALQVWTHPWGKDVGEPGPVVVQKQDKGVPAPPGVPLVHCSLST